jgi:hypothetical protein
MTRPDGDAGPERLELELRVGRDELDGYERVLIEKMFVAGERTSSALLQQHYRHFDPSVTLARPLADALRALLGPRAGSDEEVSPTSIVLALVSAYALHVSIVGIVMEWSTWWDRDALEVVTALALAICIGLGGLLASFYRQQPEAIDGDPSVRGMFGLLGLMVVVPTLLPDSMTSLELALHFGGGLGIAAFFVWTAWPRDHAAGIALRKKLLAARLYFQAQLQKQQPDLDDRWSPYLIALDLSSAVDAWCTAFDHRPERPQRESSDGSSEPVRTRPRTASGAGEPERRPGRAAVAALVAAGRAAHGVAPSASWRRVSRGLSRRRARASGRAPVPRAGAERRARNAVARARAAVVPMDGERPAPRPEKELSACSYGNNGSCS